MDQQKFESAIGDGTLEVVVVDGGKSLDFSIVLDKGLKMHLFRIRDRAYIEAAMDALATIKIGAILLQGFLNGGFSFPVDSSHVN